MTILYAVVAAVALFAPQEAASPEVTGLDEIIDRLELTELPLSDALRLISEESHVNLAASSAAATKPISVFLQDVTIRQAIETIAKSNGLWYRIDPTSHVIRVMSSEEYEHDLVLFRDEETRVFTLLYPNANEVALAIHSLFGDAVRLTLDEDTKSSDYDELNQRFQRFDLLEQRAQSFGIFGGGGGTSVIGANGQTTFGGQGTAYTRQNSPQFNSNLATAEHAEADRAYATNVPTPGQSLTPEQLQELERHLSEKGGEGIDPSVLATLRGKQTTIHVTISRRNNQIAVRSSDRDALREIESLVSKLDVPTAQVLLEVKVLSIDLGNEFHSVFDLQYDGGSSDVLQSTGQLGVGNLGTGIADQTALIYRYVNGAFRARLQLLESRRRVTTLATPLLLVANNEVARLFVGEERPIVRNVTSDTTVTDDVALTTLSPTIEIRPVGTTLLLTPNINADRSVTMRLVHETSTVKIGGATIPVQANEDGSIVEFPVDVVTSRNVNATVIAQDDTTLALGGLVEEGVTKQRAGVPWLMDLPYLGVLFRREEDIRSRSELVVLIKPRVLFTASEGHARSQEIVERMSEHPSAATLGDRALGTFSPQEVARPTPDADALESALKFQTGGGP